MYKNILRIVLGFIPGIGSLFLLGFIFDYVHMKYWYPLVGILMMIYMSYLLWIVTIL